MADLTRGVTLAADEEVTHTKMEQGIESATVSDIARVDMDSTATTVSIGTSAPTANPVPVAGHLWYDTTNKVLMEYDATDWRAVSRASNFTNRSGGALSAGDVVILDTGNNRSVTTTTTVANADVIGVVLVGGANLASVVVITEGYCPKVTVTGSTTPGDYLFTSLTAKKADPINSASNGSFGRAISTSATNVKALLGGCVMAVNASGFVASVVDTVNFTKDTTTPSGTTVVSHNLGKVPSFIQFNGYLDTNNTNCSQGFCAIQDDTPTTKQMVTGVGDSTATGMAIQDYCCAGITGTTNYMRGQLTAVTSTNFTITWSEVGSTSHGNFKCAAMVFA